MAETFSAFAPELVRRVNAYDELRDAVKYAAGLSERESDTDYFLRVLEKYP